MDAWFALFKAVGDPNELLDSTAAAALVTDRERVLYQGAFGVADVATRRPLTSDALFRIASMTKPITSVAIIMLLEDGKLRLDDTVSQYLPEFHNLHSMSAHLEIPGKG